MSFFKGLASMDALAVKSLGLSGGRLCGATGGRCSSALRILRSGFPGPSQALAASLAMAAVAAGNPQAPLLLRGEQGTPLLRLALAAHCASGGSSESFCQIPVSAMPLEAADAALSAPGGAPFREGAACVYIDELALLSSTSQRKLFSWLSGGSEEPRPSARIVCGSSRNLEKLVFEGAFDSALFYKASVLTVFMAPLRERLPDIPQMAESVLASAPPVEGLPPPRLSDGALSLLLACSWPGNDAEFESCLLYAAAARKGEFIEAEDLPSRLQTALLKESLQEALDKLERRMVLSALAATGGNLAKAAVVLGSTERVLGLRARKFGINPKRFRVKA